MATKIVEKSIESLVQDNRNFNRGTQYGDHLLDKSLQRFGLGRSILIDKNDRIIAGNKTQQKAVENGFTNVVVVETDGKTLVAVKRKDIDLDTALGREMALADNATGKHNLDWDEELIMQEAARFDFDPNDWGVDFDYTTDMEQNEDKKESCARLIVECESVSKLSVLYSELQERGFKVELKE